MVTTEFVQDVVLRSEGKLPTFTTGSTKWLRIVALGNLFLRQFARERGVNWSRYYNPVIELGNVTATGIYDLPDEVYKLSSKQGDSLRITHTDGRFTDYTVVPHNALKKYAYGNYVAKLGRTVKFNTPFTSSSPQLGGSMTVAGYELPETFSADNDEIDIDNSDWLVTTVAGDRVKNDVTRKDLRADLVSEANEIMQTLKEEEESQLEEVDLTWNPLTNSDSEW